MLVNELVTQIKTRLKQTFDDPILCQQYAQWLVQALTQKSELELISTQKIEWSTYQQSHLDDILDKIINQSMPLAYVLGSMPFAGLEILIHPPILIPRAETEEWVCNLIDQMHGARQEPLTILDLCTGSGCIALALADAFSRAQVYATDISDTALELAKQNAKHNQISNVTFIKSDLFDQIPQGLRFDVIVANPPYIPESDWGTLEPSVKNWEDKNALIASDAGMALIKKIIDRAPEFIKPNQTLQKINCPQLTIEIDATQGADLSTYLQNHGYTHVRIIKDLEGKDRLACGRIDDVAKPDSTR